MKRLALYLLVLLLASLAGCPCFDKKEEKKALRITRCASPDACPAGQVCDAATQACVATCGAPCAVDQVSVQVGDGCACLNTDGIGSPCVTDGDCPSVSGSPTVRQLCRAIASPQVGWPATTVCVPEPSCTVGASDCGDPDPSAQIEAACLAVVGNPPGPGTCTTTCVDASGTTRTDCRLDQIPKLGPDGSCTCVSRRDPFGDPCAADADCAWPSGVLGGAGPTRVCKLVNGARICVPNDFCLKEEVKGSCGNGVDDDCDGKADDVEASCQVRQCADRDADGYCDPSSCGVRAPIAAQNDRPESECRNREQAACDAPGMGMRNPSVPESCNGVDDNCDFNLNVDEGCQTFCQDVDGDGWPRNQPRIAAMSPPAGDWRLCSNLLEHPSCDDSAHRDVQSEQPCDAVCRSGTTQSCQRDGCAGSQTCLGGQAWSECAAPRPCPDGWSWNGSECSWTSPNQPSYVKYFPHRAANDQVAATGAIGYPAAGGQPGPVYVEVSLDQWSNPPAGDGGNYCGKDGFISAWVGCIHPNNARGYGRDVADHEWQDKVMIPLRCDPGDLVGVYKYSWGHFSSWHCTRQLALLVIRNHDGITSCRW